MSGLREPIEYHLPVPTLLVMTWIAILILFTISLIARITMRKIPRGLQNVFEAVFEFIFDLVDSIIGEKGKGYYPLFLGIFLFILTCNFLGLIPGFIAPTANLNTTLALALFVFVATHAIGIRNHGIINYFKHFVPNVPTVLKPFMFLIELISHLARPVSLSMRLFGNMVAKEILLVVLSSLVILLLPSQAIIQKFIAIAPIVMLPLIYLLGTLVVLIQAFVFTILAIFYISGAINIEEH